MCVDRVRAIAFVERIHCRRFHRHYPAVSPLASSQQRYVQHGFRATLLGGAWPQHPRSSYPRFYSHSGVRYVILVSL